MPANTAVEKLTAKRFHELFADEKPYFELLHGEAVRKSPGTKLHSKLQLVLCLILAALGFKSWPELTLDIDDSWQPVPDVCGSIAPVEDPYPTQAVAVAIEILSPNDRFTRVVQKCRKYAEWGIKDILVVDPVGREGWHWDTTNGDLARIQESYRFQSRPVELALTDVFRRMDEGGDD